MDVGSHGCVSLSDAATWFGIEFDELTGHAHSALADARVTRQVAQAGDGRGLSRESACPGRSASGGGWASEPRHAFPAKCPELGDLLLKLKAEGR